MARTIQKGTVVSFRTTIDGEIKRITGTVMNMMSVRIARSKGLIRKVNPDAKSPRKSGTILEINGQIEPGHNKLFYKHRSLVKVESLKDEKKGDKT